MNHLKAIAMKASRTRTWALSLGSFAMVSLAVAQGTVHTCEARAACKVIMPAQTSCSAVVTWMGSCSAGFAQGVGSVHFVKGSALVGNFLKGQPVGWTVRHDNGIPSAVDAYETQLMTLGAEGEAQPLVHDCVWDYERERVASAEPGDKACENAAGVLGQQAFSPRMWREFAKVAQRVQVAAAPAGKPLLNEVRVHRSRK
jgi:hypothetical protein